MSIATKSLLAGLSAIVVSASRLLLLAIAARRLTSTAFGEFVYLQWLIEIIFLVVSLGSTGTVSRYLAEYAQQKSFRARFMRRWIVWAVLLPVIAGVAVSIVAFLLGIALTTYGHLALLVWATATGWLAMQNAALAGQQRFDLLLKSNIATATVVIGGCFTIPFASSSLTPIFVFLACSSLVGCCFGIKQTVSLLSLTPQSPSSSLPWQTIRKYSLNIWITALLSTLVWSRGELPLVRFYERDFGVAQYGVALTLFSGAVQAVMIWVSGIAPHLTTLLANGNRAAAIGLARTFSDWQALAAGIAAVLLVCFGQELLALIFGATYHSSFQPFVTLMVGLVTLAAAAQNHLLQIVTNAEYNRNSALLGTIALYLVAVIAIPSFGIEGAAIARTSTLWCMFAMSFVLSRRHFGTDVISARTFVTIFMVVITQIAAIELTQSSMWNRIGISMLAVLFVVGSLKAQNDRLVAANMFDSISKPFRHALGHKP